MRSYYFKSTTDTSWTQQQTKKNFFSIEGSSNSKIFLKSLSSQIFFAGFKNSACSDSHHRHFLPPCHFSRSRFVAERDPLKNIWCEWMLMLMTFFRDKAVKWCYKLCLTSEVVANCCTFALWTHITESSDRRIRLVCICWKTQIPNVESV